MLPEPLASNGSVDEAAAADTRSLADITADAALVLAAVDRMQRAELHSRLALVRLRNGLGDMAAAIGRAKAKAAGADEAARATDTAALLDEFEHLVDAMLEIAGGMIPRSRAQAAEPVQAASEAPVLEDACPAGTGGSSTGRRGRSGADHFRHGGEPRPQDRRRNPRPQARATTRWLPQRPARRWRCSEALSRR